MEIQLFHWNYALVIKVPAGTVQKYLLNILCHLSVSLLIFYNLYVKNTKLKTNICNIAPHVESPTFNSRITFSVFTYALSSMSLVKSPNAFLSLAQPPLLVVYIINFKVSREMGNTCIIQTHSLLLALSADLMKSCQCVEDTTA